MASSDLETITGGDYLSILRQGRVLLLSASSILHLTLLGWVQNEDRRPKTQKRRPPQNRLEITLKWFERDYRPTQKQETIRFAVLNEFDQGLRFVHNPTKCTKRRPPQNCLEISSNWFERDCGPKQKRETTRFAFINKFDQGLRFVHNPTKSTKRRPLQNRLEITSKWFERDCQSKQKQETTRCAVITTRWEIQDTYFQAVI